jgi:hypothetical protein
MEPPEVVKKSGGGGGSSCASKIDSFLYSPSLFSLFRHNNNARAVGKFTVCTGDHKLAMPFKYICINDI